AALACRVHRLQHEQDAARIVLGVGEEPLLQLGESGLPLRERLLPGPLVAREAGRGVGVDVGETESRIRAEQFGVAHAPTLVPPPSRIPSQGVVAPNSRTRASQL